MPALAHVWTDVEAAVVGDAAGAAIEHATTPVTVQVHVAAPLALWYAMLPPHMVEQSSREHVWMLQSSTSYTIGTEDNICVRWFEG
jgi:hypothetical protein